MKKQRVPAVLHRELTEYASLMRALRTRDAMDLTSHLTRANPFALPPPSNVDDAEYPVDEPAPHPPSSVASDSRSGTPSKSTEKQSQKRKREDDQPAPRPQQRRREHWTRWPLPLDDLLVPEWTLDDEIAVLASQAVKRHPPVPYLNFTPVELEPQEDDDDDDPDIVVQREIEEDDPDHPSYVRPLTASITDYLSVILTLLASHTPPRPASMQNRIEPLNWRAVIDAIVACGIPEFSSPKVVENVTRRMEKIYGLSFTPLEGSMATSFRAVERMNESQASKRRLWTILEEADSSLFTQASPPPMRTPSPPPPSPKKRRKKDTDYRARTKGGPQKGEASTSSVRRSARSKNEVNYHEPAPPPA